MAKINSFSDYFASLRAKADEKLGVLGKDDTLEYIPTGSIVLDKLAGIGGIPCQRITQIASEPGVGKSTTALIIAASCQRLGGQVLYLDFEQAMTPKYAMAMGCDMDSGTFGLAQPIDIDAAWELIEASSNLGVNLIILDSLASMFPRIEDEDMKKLGGGVGVQARGLATFFPRFKNLCRVKHVAGLVVNQVRSKIEFGFGAGIQRSPAYSKELPGGWAPKFNTDLLYYLALRKTEKEDGIMASGKKGDIHTGTELVVTTWKNKVGMPFLRAPMYLKFGRGLDDLRSTIELALNMDIIDKASNGFWTIPSHGDFPGVESGSPILSGRGEDSIPEQLSANPAVLDYLHKKILDLNEGMDFVDQAEKDQIKRLVDEEETTSGTPSSMPMSSIPPPALTPPPIPILPTMMPTRRKKERE